jgi:protein gp37
MGENDMSEKTGIAWADSTGNPWIGCTKVSPGCKHCYAAELDANKFSRTMGGATPENPISHWGKGAPRVRTKAFWKDAVKWNRDAAKPRAGCNGPYPRPRIFPSLCDWLDDEVPIAWLADFLKLIHDTPNLDWLLLTKRPENFEGRMWNVLNHGVPQSMHEWLYFWVDGNSAPSNVWIGVSVEDQKRADERIPLLLQIPAKVRFLSVEPLLENVRMIGKNETLPHEFAATGYAWSESNIRYEQLREPMLHWVIVGGESGADRRDCGVAAIESIVDQCRVVNMPIFVKQDCAFRPGQQGRLSSQIWAKKEFPKCFV